MRHPHQWRTLVAVMLALLPVVAELTAGPAAVACTAGAVGIGDTYFPTMGNGGYDVQHYDLDIDLDVAHGDIDAATTTIDAIALADLCAFNLDFEGLTVDGIDVDGAVAAHDRNGKELTVRPATPIREGDAFTVIVRYHGNPLEASPFGDRELAIATPAPDPERGVGGGDPEESATLRGGWFVWEDEIFALGEPAGSRTWYPVNEHPSDKASYTASYTVAEPFDVVANGALVETVDNGTTTTFTWDAPAPMASYLATFHAGALEYEELTTKSGMPIRLSFAPTVPEVQREVMRTVPEMVDFAESVFGPYPFETLGMTVVGRLLDGLALETQTLPIFEPLGEARDAYVPYYRLEQFRADVFHELAHQWFGDSVSIQQWDDIWLNEGFATCADVLWAEHEGGERARDAMLQDLWASSDVGYRTLEVPVVVGDPGARELFSPVVYDRGALTLHALRLEVGDDVFFAILQEWTDRYRHGTASTADFIALAEETSGRDLSPLFDAWLFRAEMPEFDTGQGYPGIFIMA